MKRLLYLVFSNTGGAGVFVPNVDTELKRKMAAALPQLPISVIPDATPGIEWRKQVGWGYNL